MLARRRNGALDRAYGAELDRRTRRSGAIGVAVGAIGFLGWTVFDRILVPSLASDFWRVRLMATGVMALAWVPSVIWRSVGWLPRLSLLASFCSVQTAIAWMLPQVGGQLPAYTLGFTIPLALAAVLVDWRTADVMVNLGVASMTLLLCDRLATTPIPRSQLVVTLFYVGTMAGFSVVAQVVRQRMSRQEFSARQAWERQREENVQLLRQFQRLARQDALTGLSNRREFDEALERQLSLAARHGETLGLVMLDIDLFKSINDRFGHQVGDAVLRLVGTSLAQTLRSGDVVARYGGEEFAIILPGLRADDAVAVADAVRARIAAASQLADTPAVSLSGGIAIYPDHASTASALVRSADQALYRSKDAGRDRSTLADSTPTPAPTPTPTPTGSR